SLRPTNRRNAAAASTSPTDPPVNRTNSTPLTQRKRRDMKRNDTVRMAILGAVHDHQWPVFGHRGYLQEIKDIPDYDVVAFADADADVRARLAALFPDATGYES